MYSIKGKSNGRKYFIIGIIVILVMGIVSAGVYVRSIYSNGVLPVSNNKTASIVTIANGSSVNEVAVTLEDKGLVRSAWAFEWYVRSHDVRDKLQAGSYSFNPSMGVASIVNHIINGKVATDLFTILPAKRIDEIQTSFVKAGFSVEEIEKAFTPAQYVGHPALTDKPKEASLEGYLYPESFQKDASTTPETLIRASLDEMASALSPDVRAGFTRQGLTVHQGVIIASIVEKEVSSAADRQKVAQVFLRRMKMGMMLGSDVTAYYGADMADLAHSVLTDTPYNTRIHTGLPPGPIGNTSKSSLQSVAEPSDTDYLYFVAGDDKVTYFTRTLEEHNAAVKAHCDKNCQE